MSKPDENKATYSFVIILSYSPVLRNKKMADRIICHEKTEGQRQRDSSIVFDRTYEKIKAQEPYICRLRKIASIGGKVHLLLELLQCAFGSKLRAKLRDA